MTKLTADSLLWLGYAGLLSGGTAGCFSLEPLGSYAEAEPGVVAADAPLQLEAPPRPSPAELERDAGAPAAEDGGAALDEGSESELEPPALALQPSTAAAANCAGPGEFLDTSELHCYRRAEQELGWSAAQQSCRSWGGQLASIDSRAEDDFLWAQLQITFWIGVSDRVQEGRMLDGVGEPLGFTNWSAGQPDDFQGREDCVVKRGPAGAWNDLPCNSALGYVCERASD